MTKEIVPEGHKDLISKIQLLPEFVILLLWTPGQYEFLQSQRFLWQELGKRIDYLQMLQLGFLPKDPLEELPYPELKPKLKIYSEYLFSLLQVVIEGFSCIKDAARKRTLNLDFENPRQLFSQICEELSRTAVTEATSKDINVGKTLKETRSITRLAGKFFRLTLNEEESTKICNDLLSDGSWAGFSLAAIYQAVEPKYLKKWVSWQRFEKSHRELRRFLEKENLITIKWNAGHPVQSANGKPAKLDWRY